MEVPPTYVEGFHDLEATKKLRYHRLGNTALFVSHVGIGGCFAGGEYGPVLEEDGVATILQAVRHGINFVSTSPAYGWGKGEEVVGKALAQLSRKSYYISSKVGRYRTNWYEKYDFSADRVVESVDSSIARLGVDYLDVVLVHDIEFAVDVDQIVKETLPALQRLVEQGKVRYIGLSSYSLRTLKRVLQLSSVPVDVVLSYSRATLLDQQLTDYVPFFQSRGVGIINAALTGMALLTSRGPPSWHPAPKMVKEKAQEAAALCQSNNVELARLAVQFGVSVPGPDLHILSCDTVEMLQENLAAATQPQTDVERHLIEQVQSLFSSLRLRHWEGVEIGEHFVEYGSPQPPRTSQSTDGERLHD